MYTPQQKLSDIGLAKLLPDRACPSCTHSRQQTFSGTGQPYQDFSIPARQQVRSTITTILFVDTRAVAGPAMWTFQEVPLILNIACEFISLHLCL